VLEFSLAWILCDNSFNTENDSWKVSSVFGLTDILHR
jgi:hypothetical protein